MLAADCKKRRPIDFFPQVKPSLIPAPLASYSISKGKKTGGERGGKRTSTVQRSSNHSAQSAKQFALPCPCTHSQSASWRTKSWQSPSAPGRLSGGVLESCQQFLKCSVLITHTPRSGKGRKVDVKLGLRQTGAVGQRARRVRHALHMRLRGNVLLNEFLQVSIIRMRKSIHKTLENKRTVSCPRIPVYLAC